MRLNCKELYFSLCDTGPTSAFTGLLTVITAILLVNKEEEENREIVLDLLNVLEVLYTKKRRHMPRITGYVDDIVPAYPLPVFKESFRLSKSTFETLTVMLA